MDQWGMTDTYNKGKTYDLSIKVIKINHSSTKYFASTSSHF